jgi:hypothetical protein
MAFPLVVNPPPLAVRIREVFGLEEFSATLERLFNDGNADDGYFGVAV